MKILITGGAGCLGSNLIEHFLPKNVEIYVIDNFSTGKRESIPEQPGLKVIEGSIANADLVNKVFLDFMPTHVIHSAASYKDPNNWIEDCDTNILGAINIARAAIDVKIKRIINFQTALCYGRPKITPIPIDHPLDPFTSYGISKTAGEYYLMHSGLPVISLRLANICGPRLATGPIPSFYKRLKEGLNCFCSDTVRDFLDMSDFINFINIALKADIPNGVFNVSSGEGHSILDIFNIVKTHLNINSPGPQIIAAAKDDVSKVVLDSTNTEKIFNWKANVSFENIIKNQLLWYDQYGVNNIFSHLAYPKIKNNS